MKIEQRHKNCGEILIEMQAEKKQWNNESKAKTGCIHLQQFNISHI